MSGGGGTDRPADRVLGLDEVVRRFGPPRDRRVVFTNGVFDLLHPGHVRCLVEARSHGDVLVVGVNSDESARRLKPAGRPVQSAEARAEVLAALRPVDAVTVFDDDTPARLVEALLPDVLVKGADYEGADVAGAEAVLESGGSVELIPLAEGHSTSRLVDRVRRGAPATVSPGPPEEDDPEPFGERLLVATRSPHKMEEIRGFLADLPVEVVSLAELGVEELPAEERIERFGTFEENAFSKARHFHERTGLFTAADDSGLCVDALDGAPGVHTKRFAPDELAEEFGRDEANNLHLLDRLADVPEEERGARYRCAVVAYDGRRARTWTGQVEGRIARRPRGDGGFGYDPLFLVPEHGGTFGELPPEVKASMSHRARAFDAFRGWLLGELEGG